MINNQITTRLERAIDALNNQMIRVFVNPQKRLLLFAILIVYHCLTIKAFAMRPPDWDAGHVYPAGDVDIERQILEQTTIDLYDNLPEQFQRQVNIQAENWLWMNPASGELERRAALTGFVREAHDDFQEALRNLRPRNEYSFWSWNTLGRPILYTACAVVGLSLAGLGLAGLLDYYVELVSPPQRGAVHYIQYVVTTLTNTSSSIERWLYSNGHFAKQH